MRRIIRSVRARRRSQARDKVGSIARSTALVCLLVCASVGVASAQDPAAPDSSLYPPDSGSEPESDGSLGPPPEVGPEPSQGADTTGVVQPGVNLQTGAEPDTTGVVQPGVNLQTGAEPDTSSVPIEVPLKPNTDAALDTLRLPTPQPTGGAAAPAVGGAHPTPPAAPPPSKPRVGVFGLHPAAILIGLAALNYFIIKAASN